MAQIEIQNVSKFYGNKKVLNNISLSIEKGNSVGLIGPNGSGKTTLLSIISGIINQSEGSIIRNKELKIGALIEKPIFYPHLSGSENLSLIAQLRNIKSFNSITLLERVGLQANANKKFSAYSMGMKQRLGIAAALIDNPDIILLDEPTNGLDPFGIKEIREIVILLHQSGKTIMVSSHILYEIEQLCTDILLINAGDVKFYGSKQAFLGKTENTFLIFTKSLDLIGNVLNKTEVIDKIIYNRNYLEVFFKQKITSSNIKNILIQNGIDISDVIIKETNLEDTLFHFIP